MTKPKIVAEVEMKGRRIYLIHSFKGREVSRVDATPIWHFCKEVLSLPTKEN